MQALEKIGILEQDEEKGGRRITQSGQRDLDREFWFSVFSIWRRMGQRDIGLSETLTNLWYDIGIAQTTIQADDEEEE